MTDRSALAPSEPASLGEDRPPGSAYQRLLLQILEGSFYDAVAGLPVGDDLAACFGRFMKHIYYPVKPRVMPELWLLDSREPERLAELEHLLAGLGLPGWCSSAQRPAACAAAFSAVRGPLAVLPRAGIG